MILRYLNPASAELFEAIEYYENVDAGLGIRFFNEIRKAEERIKKFPNGWAKLSKRTRRVPLGEAVAHVREEVLRALRDLLRQHLDEEEHRP